MNLQAERVMMGGGEAGGEEGSFCESRQCEDASEGDSDGMMTSWDS